MFTMTGRSQKERLWLVGGALAAFVLILIGYFFFIGPQRSTTSDVNGQAASARTQNATLQAHISTLQTESRNMPRYKSQLAAAQQALPATSGLPDFIRTLQSLGTATHTDAVNLTVGAPTDVSLVAAPVATTTTPTASATPSATPSATAGSTTATPPTASVYGLTITAQVNGSANALDGFLQKLQDVQPRAVLITQITEGSGATGAATAGSTSGASSLQLTMQAFVAPSSSSENAQLAAAAH
jgi:hypothetical protein